MDEKLRRDKLRIFRADYREKHKTIWSLFILSVIITIPSVVGVAYMNEYPWNSSFLWYCLCTIGYTFGLGYISAFSMYYLNEYLPKTLKLFDDIQKTLLLLDRIYYSATKFEEALLNYYKVKPDNYAEYISSIIVSTSENGKCILFKEVVDYMHRIAIEIDFEEKNLYALEGEVMSVETVKAVNCLNVYKSLYNYNAVRGINNIKEVDRNDLVKALENFKAGLDSLENYYKRVRKYSVYKIE